MATLLFGSASLYGQGGTNGMSAANVIGQPNFTVNSLIRATGFSSDGPYGIAVDAVNNKVYVADYGNHRVLRFSSTAALQNQGEAELVFGQADIFSNGRDRGATVNVNTLDNPVAVAVDA